MLAAVPVCTIWPELVLAMFDTCRSRTPALSTPAVLTSVCPGWALATMDSVPGVVTVARLVVTLPWVAVMPMVNALVLLPDRSTLAPCSEALPAARLVPPAARPLTVVTLRSPTVARLPSALMPAPSTPVVPLRLLAVRVVLRWAVRLPSLLAAPLTATFTSLPARSEPTAPFRSEPACTDRSVAAAIRPVLVSAPAMLSVVPAVAELIEPSVLASEPA